MIPRFCRRRGLRELHALKRSLAIVCGTYRHNWTPITLIRTAPCQIPSSADIVNGAIVGSACFLPRQMSLQRASTGSPHDGYRVVLERGQVRLFTRNRHDWTDRYPSSVVAARNLRCNSAIIDGEAVVQAARVLLTLRGQAFAMWWPSPQRHPLTPVANAGMPGRSAPLPGITTAVVATRANPAATSSAIQCVVPSMTISPKVFALDDLSLEKSV